MKVGIYVKCVRHSMIIETGSPASREIRHERHGDRCNSETFWVVEQRQVNRETAQAEIIRLETRPS